MNTKEIKEIIVNIIKNTLKLLLLYGFVYLLILTMSLGFGFEFNILTPLACVSALLLLVIFTETYYNVSIKPKLKEYEKMNFDFYDQWEKFIIKPFTTKNDSKESEEKK